MADKTEPVASAAGDGRGHAGQITQRSEQVRRSLAVPQGVEQFMNADRLVELGVARRVDTADAIAETFARR